jgi:hypothetical protein
MVATANTGRGKVKPKAEVSRLLARSQKCRKLTLLSSLLPFLVLVYGTEKQIQQFQ